MLNKLCMPALIYLIFSFTHVVIDTYKELYNTAIIEVWISVVFTLLLNLLCQQNLGFISWLIISIPFLLMTVIASLILFVFKLNPATGKALQPPQPTSTQSTESTQSTQSTESQPASTQSTQPQTQPQPQTTQTTESQPASTQSTQSTESQPQPTQSTQTQTQPQPQTTQPTESQPASTQSTQPQTQPQPQPSRYSYPVTAFYGSLGNYKNPFSTR